MRPARNHLVLTAALCLLAASPGCKKDKETTPPGADAAAPVAPAPAPTDQPAATAPGATPPAAAPAMPQPGAATHPGAKPDGGAPVDAGKTDAGGTTSGGANTPKFQACIQACGAELQKCLTPAAADGGFPRLDPTVCNASFEKCRSACAP